MIHGGEGRGMRERLVEEGGCPDGPDFRHLESVTSVGDLRRGPVGSWIY